VAGLLAAVGESRHVLILPHNDPDPDAIASALALGRLLEKYGIKGHLAYRGLIGRAENKALVRYLGHPLRHLAAEDLRGGMPIALVDTQPGTGNNALPRGRRATIVFDHHPIRPESHEAAFAELRPELGATSTLMSQYLEAAGIEPDAALATALFYGIKTDTLGLVRGAQAADVEAYFRLQKQIDVEALIEIERAQVPPEYFRRLDAALHAAEVHGDVVISYVGPMQRPDLAAEMADLLLRLQGVRWTLCMGAYKHDLILAVRSRHPRGGAGHLVQAIVAEQGTAGGHGTMAGGQVPLQGREPGEVAEEMAARALAFLAVPGKETSRPLLD
jgi:nanoRNase/pAp phosphatase (c-di-AMP/oligoRNAs hydrolase)